MKKLIYAPVPEQQIIYVDRELAVINNDKVIYLQPFKLSDMSYLYYIMSNIWQLADSHIDSIISYIFDIYDNDKAEIEIHEPLDNYIHELALYR